MPVPTQRQLHRPVLEILSESEGGAHAKDIKSSLAGRFSMTVGDLAETVPSGQTTKFDNRATWAISYLKRAGLIDAPSRSHYEIAPAGRGFLSAHKSGDISAGQLKTLIAKRKSEKADEHRGGAPRENAIESARGGLDEASEESVDPRERMDAIYRELNAALADELLDSVKRLSPQNFERLVVRLLEKMGYGEGRQVGGSGDQGIDGVINQDPLGLEMVYIQAKRWESAVGEPEIRNFAGSLDVKGANKGVFITTSSFNSNAKDTARNISLGGKLIRLIDGNELAELMIRHDVGVVAEMIYALKKPDENYFSDDL